MRLQHSLVIIDDGSASSEFACACGARGTYADVLRHVAETTDVDEPELTPSLRSLGFPQSVVAPRENRDNYAAVIVSAVPSEDFGGGDTKAHYLPNEPKIPAHPALPEVVDPLSRDVTWGAAPSYVEPERTSAPAHPSHHVGRDGDTPREVPVRAPASSFADPDPTPTPLPPTPATPATPARVESHATDEAACPICAQGTLAHDLPEITTWSCGHEVHKKPPSIAEAFQAMLRSAYQAGTQAEALGDTFESWYQREVLQ